MTRTLKLLIADDQPPLRQMIREICTESSDVVYEAVDGLAALDAYLDHRPDWVLMDIMMPQMDGLTAAAKIIGAFPDARILVLTQLDQPGFREAAKAAGAQYYFTKDDLQKVRATLQASRQE